MRLTRGSNFRAIRQKISKRIVLMIAGLTLAAGAVLTPFVVHADSSYTLWDNSVTPGTVDFGETAAYELGMKFKPTVDGQITGVRFYKSSSNTGTHIGNLWDSSGSKLASVTFSGESASGWQEADFSSPVNVTANTTYVVSYWAPNGHYSGDDWYFVQPFTNEPLITPADSSIDHNGVYNYGSDSFPTSSYEAANYYVEPVFTTSNSIPSQPNAPSRPNDAITVFTNQTPSTASSGDSTALQIGMKFHADKDGRVYGVRFYKGSSNDGVHVGYLWSSDGSLLSSVRFDNETSSGWQEAIFQSPVNITANTTYIVSYFAPHGHYAFDSNYFTSAVDNGLLHAYDSSSVSGNDVYLDGTAQTMPSSSFNASNYWVDAVYAPNCPDPHVSGTLSSNQEWQSGCTYEVDNTVTVPSGTTLTIDPGAVVKYNSSSNSGIQVNSGGTLNANGTASSPVVFTSLNDNSVGGTTGSGSPAVGDYPQAITMHGGTATVHHANFEYASSSLGSTGSDDASVNVNVTDSTFSNDYVGVGLTTPSSVSLVLQRNTFNTVNGSSDVVSVGNDSDLTGIVLSGSDKNTFSGTGSAVTLLASGSTVPSGSTWEINSASGAAIAPQGSPGVTVNGTVNLDSGVVWMSPDNTNNASTVVNGTLNMQAGAIAKSKNSVAFQVNSGGTVNAAGTSASPVVFTSLNDNSIGGSTGSGIPVENDYGSAVVMNGGIATMQHTNFEYASNAIGGTANNVSNASVTVSDSSFTNDLTAVTVTNSSPVSVSLQRNTVSVTGATNTDAIAVSNDADLSGIVLSGTNKNTLSGSGPAVTVLAQNSAVPSGSTWEIGNDSGAILASLGNAFGNPGITVGGTLNMNSGTELLAPNSTNSSAIAVNGTMDVADGVIVKSQSSSPVQVNTGGTLSVNGTVGSPVVFTSLNDNSMGGSTGNGTPAVNDYGSAIAMKGGSVTVSHADFKYAASGVGDVSGASDVHASVADSSFANSLVGVQLTAPSSVTLGLQRNTFNVVGAASNDAVSVNNDTDLSGIVLSGTNKNTFSGSGPAVIVLSRGSSVVPTGSTWEVSSDSGAAIASTGNPLGDPNSNVGSPGLTVNGTLTLDSGTEVITPDADYAVAIAVNGTMNIQNGAIFKNLRSLAVQVNSGGVLNAAGTASSPITFTSLNDNSIGGDTGTGSPSAGDYSAAISMHGGTATVQHANFKYAGAAISHPGGSGDTGSSLTVADSAFMNNSQGIVQSNNAVIALQRNSFDLNTSGSGNYPISVDGDPDVSGILLAGSDKNTFAGSGSNLTVSVNGSVPSGSTWTVDPSSQAVVLLTGLNGNHAVSVHGTVTINPGTTVKVSGDGFDVQSDGVLNATGSQSNPIVFTSFKDDSVGGDSNGNGSSSGSTGDYASAIRFEQPGSSDVVSYTVFKDAGDALSIGITGTLSVNHDQFTNNGGAFIADTTSINNPVLGTLASACLYPYANSIEVSNSWFGHTGLPGANLDIFSFLGQTLPDGYPGLSSVYSGLTTMAQFTANAGDNTVPWSLFTCGIPNTDIQVAFPVTPLDILGFKDSGLASNQLWTQANLAE